MKKVIGLLVFSVIFATSCKDNKEEMKETIQPPTAKKNHTILKNTDKPELIIIIG